MNPAATPSPNPLPRPQGERARLEAAWRTPPGWRILSSVNNVHIGLLYIGTAFVFMLLAGVLALLMRAQLAVPGNTLLDASTYNQVFTMHGTVMMFLFAVPVVEAVAVYLLPGMLGARDLPFPRLSAYAYWAYAFGGLAFFCTLFFGAAPDGGWFMYPPLTDAVHSPGIGADFWLLGIGFIEISAIAGAIELIVGILMTRAPGMTLARMPVYAWAMLVVGFMIVFAFPAVIAGTTLLELERALGWPFFDAARGGDPLLWQHLFWFFGHPEVYIIFLPAVGLVSTMVPALAGTRLVGRLAIVWALVAVGVLSFVLWVHHMFTAGLGRLALTLTSVASLAIAVPAGLQVFAWIATLWRGRLRWRTPSLFLVGFLVTFVMGGLTGVMLALLPFDWQAHDSYFVVAHLHYVLIGGMVFPLFAALYYWMPLVRGHALSERAGRWVCGLMFGGFHLAFFPMHVVGMLGMPRRVYTYEAGLGWEPWNLAASIGAAVFAAGVLLFCVDAVRTWRRPERPAVNVWQAPTLEWLPAHDYGTRSQPQVRSAEPLWDQPGLAEEVEQGRHWLPGSATGQRESLLTSPRHARPLAIAILPGNSWLPVLGAFGTAAFFLLLTAKLVWPALAGGLLAVGCVLAWLWETDRIPGAGPGSMRPAAVAAEGCAAQGVLPIGGVRSRAPGWWATWIFLAVDGTVFASFLFAHLHAAMASDVCPPPGARLPDAGWIGAVVAACLAAAGLTAASGRLLDRTGGGVRRTTGLAAGLQAGAGGVLAAAAVLLWWAHREAGLVPAAQAWSATLAVLNGFLLLHGALLVLAAGYLLARQRGGLFTPVQRGTRDNVALLVYGSSVMGVVAACAPYAVVAAMR